MTGTEWPTFNAILNLISFILLLTGYTLIKNKHRTAHGIVMITALTVSALFFISYLHYHYQVGSVPYPHYDWTRSLYFVILIPHIVLAALMIPFILAGVWFAAGKQFDKHKRVMKWTWPVWVFVSISGVVVYLMLYHL